MEKNNKAIAYIVGLVVVILAIVGFVVLKPTPAPAPITDVQGGSISNVANGVPAGLQFGDPNGVTVNYAAGKIASASKTNTAYFKNVTGRTLYIDLADVSTDGIASSTFKIYAYSTSTAPRTIYDATAPTGNGIATGTQMLISGFSFATSSTATTTSNLDLTGNGKVIQLLPNYYFNVLLTGGINCTGATCETATSTRRGFNIFYRLRFHD